MKFIDSLLGRRSLENPDVPITGRNLAEILHGEGHVVTAATAMRLSAVYSCIYVLASSWGQLPLAVLRRTGDTRELATDHPAYYLLHDSPNVWETSYKWRETRQSHVCGWGNAYTPIRRTRKGEIYELGRCTPADTTLVKVGGRWTYASLDEDGSPISIAPEDMIHIRALGTNGREGISPIRQHAELLGLGLAAQQYGKDFFDGGGRPTGLITLRGTPLQKDGWERLTALWNKAATKLRESKNKTLLLPADLDYKALTIAPEDAQFIETRKMNRSEIASIFNVPAHMINDLEKATFSNISEQGIQFVRHTMMPWVVNWEQELNRKIFTAAERRAGYYVKANLAGLLRGTPKERAEFYHYAITDGWMDRNEVRAFEDMNPREGLSEMLVSVNARPSDAAIAADSAKG